MSDNRGSLRGAAIALGLACLALGPGRAHAVSLAVDVWSNRGDAAVFQPGESIEISARANDDAFMLVYEIDSEGYVHVLFPHTRRTPFVEGRTTLVLPEAGGADRLVVQGPVGQGYIIAVASREPFRDLPWFLRPYDAQAEALGYQPAAGPDSGGTEPDPQAGVTAEGRVVGDPFVAMERIRRALLADPTDAATFATAYTTYYVHDAVQYPRYLCYDCHRPGYYSWWQGFDPYYTTCSAFEFHVNVGWWWGPTYWFGTVPYYWYAYRPSCPPRYLACAHGATHYSSWDGWTRWNNLWGGPLRRFKSAPPAGYVPPGKSGEFGGIDRPARKVPPGFLAGGDGRGEGRTAASLGGRTRAGSPGVRRGSGISRWSGGEVAGNTFAGRTLRDPAMIRPRPERMPVEASPPGREPPGGARERPAGEWRRGEPPRGSGESGYSRGDRQPAERPPGTTRGRESAPAREARPAPPRDARGGSAPTPRSDGSRQFSPSGGFGRGGGSGWGKGG